MLRRSVARLVVLVVALPLSSCDCTAEPLSEARGLLQVPEVLDFGATLRQGDVTQISFMARYQFTPKISLQLNGSNLLDEKYYVLDDYDNTHYGEPLGVSASLNWRF